MKFDPEGNVTSFGEFHVTLMTKECNRSVVGNEEQYAVSLVSFFRQRKRKLSFIRNLGYRQEI